MRKSLFYSKLAIHLTLAYPLVHKDAAELSVGPYRPKRTRSSRKNSPMLRLKGIVGVERVDKAGLREFTITLHTGTAGFSGRVGHVPAVFPGSHHTQGSQLLERVVHQTR